MRKINAWLFVTLDGVTEAPENWVLADDEMFGAIEADYAAADALLWWDLASACSKTAEIRSS